MNPQSSRINGVRNQEGTATLSCQAAGHAVEGTITFKNCH
jgi:hypothetical protein